MPEANSQKGTGEQQERIIQQKIIEKGLPLVAFSKIRLKIRYFGEKIWRFILEAKGLRQPSNVGYKIKKIFRFSLKKKVGSEENSNFLLKEKISEKDLLEAIKKEPKNLKNYDALGKLYMEERNYVDAKDIYLYLINHESGHSDFFARLAFCHYQLKEFEKAAENYEKSIALDSAHPNRYYNLSHCFAAQRKFEIAKQYLEKALEMEPQNEKYQQTLQKIILEIEGQKNLSS